MAGGKERKNGEVMKKKQRPIKASVKMRGRFFCISGAAASVSCSVLPFMAACKRTR